MTRSHTYERSHRFAPRQNFGGGYQRATPIEIESRMQIISGWMDVAKYAALKVAVESKIARIA